MTQKDAPPTRETSVPPVVANRPKIKHRWPKGVSGNPAGRPKIEPRVRRYARRYDRAMCEVLASLARDEKVSPTERRRAAMDLIAIGSGRPALVQEVVGAQPASVVQVNVAAGAPSTPLDRLDSVQASRVYQSIIAGRLDVDDIPPPRLEHATNTDSATQPATDAELLEDDRRVRPRESGELSTWKKVAE
jgi:hypothetical protein